MILSTNLYVLINQVSTQVNDKLTKNKTNTFYDAFNYAIEEWCKRLETVKILNFASKNTDDITVKVSNEDVKKLSKYIYKEWDYKEIIEKVTLRRPFYSLFKPIFKLLKIGESQVNFIVLLAFVIVAVLFLAYILNNKQKETTDLEDSENLNQADIRQDQTSKVEPIVFQPNPVQKSLILVIPAEKSYLIELLINNQTVRLTKQDCSNLYNATRYLCLDIPENLSRQLSSINNELFVKEGEESASDIYFVKIDNINAKEQGFQPNANKNVKTNAFYRLVNLQAMVTPRYRLEAYQNFNVY